MKTIWAVLFVVLLVSSQGTQAVAQSDELKTAIEHFKTLMDKSEYDKAEPFAKRALELSEKELGKDHLDTATRLVDLGWIYSIQGRDIEVEPLYKRSLTIREKALAPDHPDIAHVLRVLARLYSKQLRYAEAEPLFKRSIAIREKFLGPDHKDMTFYIGELADVYKTQGRYAEAEPLYKRALTIREKTYGPDSKFVAFVLNNLAEVFANQGRYADAEALFRRSLTIWEKELGSDHPELGIRLANLGYFYVSHGRYADAEPFYKRALAIDEKAAGPGHPIVATRLNNLGFLYHEQGRYADAEPLLKRAVAIREKALGPDHPDTVSSITLLGNAHYYQESYDDAEPLHRRALAIKEKMLGSDNPRIVGSLIDLAYTYQRLRRYKEAEPLFRRALAIREKALGPEHPDVAVSLNNLAGLYKDQSRYGEAEPLYKRALAIREKALGPDHPAVADSLNSLAELYFAQGNYEDAEPFYKRVLAINEKIYGPDHPNVARVLMDLGELYDRQDRSDNSMLFYKRALVIQERALGPDHPDVATSLLNLSYHYRYVPGLYDDAILLAKRAVAIMEKVHGPDHSALADFLNGLALVYHSGRRYAEAEALYNRSLAIQEKTYGPNHLNLALVITNLGALNAHLGRYGKSEAHMKHALAIADTNHGPNNPAVLRFLINLASMYENQGRYSDAEPLFRRALAISEKAYGPEHPKITKILYPLAYILHFAQGLSAEGFDLIRRATTILRKQQNFGDSLSNTSRLNFAMSLRIVFDHLKNIPQKNQEVKAETFEFYQLVLKSSVSAAIAKMGARFGSGDDALAKLSRARQDAAEKWPLLDKLLVEAISAPPDKHSQEVIERLLNQQSDLDNKLQDLDNRLIKEFPEYVELTNPRPVPISETQSLLEDDEALLGWLVYRDHTFLWLVRKDGVEMFRLDIKEEYLDTLVMDLRSGLDPTGMESISDLLPFDTSIAHELYDKILAPAEPSLEGIKHLFVVPHGPLQSIPLSVLVTNETGGDFSDFSNYRNVPWLADKYALTTLPSVSSLRALRRFAKSNTADKPFGGFGDPLLEGHPGQSRGVKLAGLFKARGVADVNAVRSQLAPLPETADELAAIAAALGANDNDLFLRERATETRAKEADLRNYKVLAFATHGLVAGDLTGLAEPALVLTPPSEGTPTDDGLLTASEVAQLKLNADLVVLSACNTASNDGTPGAEALSGLAKAFFYAGSRSLLVSHWPVFSDASVVLTTKMLSEVANDNTIGRSEALKRSMQALRNTPDKPHYAHPMFWAPFVVVGEGGVAIMGSKEK